MEAGAPAILPETASVYWRRRVDEGQLRSSGRLWTLTTVAHVVPFLGAGALLFVLQPLTFPVTLACIAHAWIIPELYAQRGANVVRPKATKAVTEAAEQTAVGLLGDLVGHEARALHGATGLVPERGRLGTWLVGPAGALLVRPGRHGKVHCWCVRVNEPSLPRADRIAHLLLALRADEQGFATVANQTFAGARWRVRRRMAAEMRPALDFAAEQAIRPVG